MLLVVPDNLQHTESGYVGMLLGVIDLCIAFFYVCDSWVLSYAMFFLTV